MTQDANSPAAKPSLSRIVVTVCTYNESENIGRLLTEIRSSLPEADILVIDDESPDGTGQVVLDRAASDPKVYLHSRHGERGLGSATLFAFQHVIAQDYDILINLDADFSHHPRYLPELVKALQTTDADVAIGSRYVASGSIKGWPLKRHIMSKSINFWARSWMGLPIRDCSGSYRAYRCDLLRKVDFSEFRSRGYSVQEELLFRCARGGAKFTEVPIEFVDREVGESKINMNEAMKAVWIIARCGLEPKKKGTTERV
ncbi:polyprenol monophosphomannose synthase [Rubinisphaera margarita]|uniref:polyprenol monophosphomannose synthase n=1 Tax=Rubinisphaera margarita TaxID=2909586 RepID=UPI001EE8E7F4|nr:polyprenol monophosphomannose synthase [Rubinisphaera margarita]MCG6156676.1 polyprenol monophosphomannose synthase [Rubinisphaera margarita]